MTRPVAFGVFVDPSAAERGLAERLAAIADEDGLELVGIQDHPYNAGFLDTFTLITHLAARTQSVRLYPSVANLQLRPPFMLAKQAASIDILSGGRFELGLGAGGFGDAAVGMGASPQTRTQGREALSEAIDILRSSWAGTRYQFEGTYYQAPLVRAGPVPAHDIGIWLGVTGPKAVELVGRKADGWSISHGYVPLPKARELGAIIDAAATDAGRDPGAIVRIYNVAGHIGDVEGQAFSGPVSHWIDTLTELYAETGLNTFVFWPLSDAERQVRLFAREVAPAVREALAKYGA